LEYSLDQHLAGNRAPFNVGVHAGIYSSKYTYCTATTATDRQWAIEQFIQYALSKPDVRIVTPIQVIKWLRNPCPLQASSGPFNLTINQPTHGKITANPQKNQYNNGEVVTLSISLDPGYQITGWTGAASGTTNSVQVTMTFDKTVSATLSLIPGQCPDKTDILNTGAWTGQQDGKSTIATSIYCFWWRYYLSIYSGTNVGS